MRMGRKSILAVLMASVASVTLATAPSASATIHGPETCNPNEMSITRAYTPVQCFSWDGIVGGSKNGSYLFVNDWYGQVSSGEYHLTVSWYDTQTGHWYPVYVQPKGVSNPPTGSCLLYSITFDS
jgi:hypothetical protein